MTVSTTSETEVGCRAGRRYRRLPAAFTLIRIFSLHGIRAALLGCALSARSASAGLPDTPSGLTCTDATGAVIRLNLDPVAKQFQKEGFPISPLVKSNSRTIVLTRDLTRALFVEASLDRRTLVYTALSQDLKTRTKTQMGYQCVVSAPFPVSGAR
jgi:hypothetical protein